jgi:hypothetical protein
MRQGSIRAPFKVRKHDLYETPPAAIHALMRCEKLPEMIWEPAAGRGAISRELRAAGHTVFASDLAAYKGRDSHIMTKCDFFDCTDSFHNCIVTNPPFKKADAFIRHGLSLGCDVIVLLRLMALEGERRSDIIEHLRRVWVGIERLPMMHRDGWNGPKLETGAMPFGWFVFTARKRLRRVPIQLQRVSWRGS